MNTADEPFRKVPVHVLCVLLPETWKEFLSDMHRINSTGFPAFHEISRSPEHI